jgi:signal transduction histidine kinase
MRILRFRRPSLRLRTTAGALVVVVIAFCGAGLVVLGVLEREMTAQIDSTLTANTDFINRSMADGTPLPTGQGPTDLYVQFIGADGRVIGASTAAHGVRALSEPVSEQRDITTAHDQRIGAVRVLAQPVAGNPSVTLAVARSANSIAEVRDSLTRLLIVMAVAGSALLGVIIWIVVGRALRPVDNMRRTAATITERDLSRRLEQPGTGDELDRLAHTLNALLARLDQAVARERQFVADASHELRSPIAGVRALLETEPVDSAAVVRVRAEALGRLGELQDLVEDLLVLAKTDATELEAPPAPVDLDELVLGQARQLERTTSLRIDTSKVSGGQVAGREVDLGRMVENLASNAARFASTTVAFSVHQSNGTVEFAVSDDGPGVPASDRERIFERFRTLEDSRASQRCGAGLGLSIAAAIVAAHHGSIRVDDAPSGGATFAVHLPAHAATSTGGNGTSHDSTPASVAD